MDLPKRVFRPLFIAVSLVMAKPLATSSPVGHNNRIGDAALGLWVSD